MYAVELDPFVPVETYCQYLCFHHFSLAYMNCGMSVLACEEVTLIVTNLDIDVVQRGLHSLNHIHLIEKLMYDSVLTLLDLDRQRVLRKNVVFALEIGSRRLILPKHAH
jgi:hypothetical protein